MYELIKLSTPGWSKKFDTERELAEELSRNVCQMCRRTWGSDLQSMWASDCGGEFHIEGLTLDYDKTNFNDLSLFKGVLP
jgi:hypothetical protein